MNKKYRIDEFVCCETQQSVVINMTERFIRRRKELKMSQKQLAVKSGVPYASVRRFENESEISLKSLIKIADAVNCLTDFNNLFSNENIISLKDYKND